MRVALRCNKGGGRMSGESRRTLKRTLGIILLFVLLYLIFRVYQVDQTLGIFLFVGIGLGFIESHSEVGIASGYVDFFVTGSRTRFYGLLMLFGLGSVATIIIHSLSALNGSVPSFLATSFDTIIPGTTAVSPVNLGVVVGSFLFGVGLSLNKGCGLGTLRNIGLGQFRYVLTFLAILVGTIPGQWLKYQLDQSVLHQIEVQLYFPNAIGYLGTFVLGVILFTILIFWALYIETVRKRQGYYKEIERKSVGLKNPLQKKHPVLFYLLEKKWARLVSVILITGLLVLALLGTGEHLAVTQSYVYPAVYILQLIGLSLNHPAFAEPISVIENGLLSNHIVVQNIGIVFGALLLSLLSITLTTSNKVNVKEFGWFTLSGLLMGIGAILAGGCIVGALYSGIVNFSLSGWVVFLFMSLGIWVTVRVMNGKISTIPEME